MIIGLIQFNPIPRNKEANMKRASGMLNKVNKGDIDYLILPEMIFTGYIFNSKEDIKDFVEDGNDGDTVKWAKETAKKYGTFVQVGYPQVIIENGEPKYYNSICIVDPNGKLIANYHKTFLFEQDEYWAEEGKSFQTYDIPELAPYSKVGPGICMDINPKQFKAPFEKFEFGNFHTLANTNFVPCSMAWLRDKNTTARTLMNYWAVRIHPLIVKYNESNDKLDTDLIYAICNRTGKENDTHFGGGSCVIKVSPDGIINMGSLGMDDETLLIVDTE